MAGTDYNVELILTAQNKMSKELKKVSGELTKMKKHGKQVNTTFSNMKKMVL